jgi:hypothetical protein
MCTLDYDATVKAYLENPRTARKEHACSACGATIHNGEAYCYVSYVGDSTARSEHECFPCWWTRAEFREAHGAFPIPSFLWEELKACIEGDRTSEWRPRLAALERRWRTSTVGRRELARTIYRNALSRQLALTRRVLRKRAA